MAAAFESVVSDVELPKELEKLKISVKNYIWRRSEMGESHKKFATFLIEKVQALQELCHAKGGDTIPTDLNIPSIIKYSVHTRFNLQIGGFYSLFVAKKGVNEVGFALVSAPMVGYKNKEGWQRAEFDPKTGKFFATIKINEIMLLCGRPITIEKQKISVANVLFHAILQNHIGRPFLLEVLFSEPGEKLVDEEEAYDTAALQQRPFDHVPANKNLVTIYKGYGFHRVVDVLKLGDRGRTYKIYTVNGVPNYTMMIWPNKLREATERVFEKQLTDFKASLPPQEPSGEKVKEKVKEIEDLTRKEHEERQRAEEERRQAERERDRLQRERQRLEDARRKEREERQRLEEIEQREQRERQRLEEERKKKERTVLEQPVQLPLKEPEKAKEKKKEEEKKKKEKPHRPLRFSTYIHRVLKQQIDEDAAISKRGIQVMEQFCQDLMNRIAMKARALTLAAKQKTMKATAVFHGGLLAQPKKLALRTGAYASRIDDQYLQSAS